MSKTAATDAFRFSRVALGIRTKTAAQKLILLTLAIRANGKTGICHPSYESLGSDTGLSRSSIARSLRYLRDNLKVLQWKQGHCNQFTKPMANLYTLDYSAMLALSQESAESHAESHSESAECHLEVAEYHSEVAECHLGVAESQAMTLQLPYTTTNQSTTNQTTGGADAFLDKSPYEKSEDRTPNEVSAGAALSLSSELSTTAWTLDELRAKLDYFSKHGGCEPEDYRALQQKVESMEAKTQERPKRKTG